MFTSTILNHFDLSDQEKDRIKLFRHNLRAEKQRIVECRELPT